MKGIYVFLIAISIGFAVGAAAEFLEINKYVKLMLIITAVSIPFWFADVKRKRDKKT